MKHSAAKRSYLARAIGLHLHLMRGQVVEVFVAHDSDCLRLQGGACTCQPEMTAALPDGRRADIGDTGELLNKAGLS